MNIAPHAALHPALSPDSHRFCVAPMMDYTDRHCRYLMRLLSRRARLYTEMVTATALVRGGNPARLLDFHASEQPLALQLGGSDPAQLVQSAVMAEDWGYSEINLNVGCPSDRVTSGRFGACLMAEPELVATCIAAMRAAVRIPVTVKTRIGIDDMDSEAHLDAFVRTVAATGCDTFIIHARKAWLQGLSPKENREIPPLNYPRVYQLKRTFPHLRFVLNGGLKTLEAARSAMTGDGTTLDGVMLGRAPYDAPYMLADVDAAFYGSTAARPTRTAITEAYVGYAEHMVSGELRAHHVLRHIGGLFYGCSNARAWRQAVARIGQNGSPPQELTAIARRLEESQNLAA